MSENHNLVLKAHFGLCFLVNEKAVFASPKLAKDVLLAKFHPLDASHYKFVLSCIDAVASGAEISIGLVQNQTESGFVGVLVTARDLFHEFDIENLGDLTAALNNALANTVQSMRYKAEHPGVHIIHTSTGVRRRSPTLEAGPGELVTREVVAGAAAVWTAKRPWEIGRAKMLEAVCSCMLYLRNVEGFRKLMKDNHDFGAALAQVSLGGAGRIMEITQTASRKLWRTLVDSRTW
ncbi:hypothetical protein SLS64_007157 [Diaporthe eres]